MVSLFFCFNPHTHEGCDLNNERLRRWLGVSIHTPTKGVTFYTPLGKLHKAGFNPHTHEGCDLAEVPSFRCLKSFNPHTHEGCDKCVHST